MYLALKHMPLSLVRCLFHLSLSSLSLSLYVLIRVVPVWVYLVWMAAANYGTRFGSDDLPNKLFYLFTMGGVVGVTMNINEGTSGFVTLGYFAAWIELVFMCAYIRIVVYLGPTSRAVRTFCYFNIFKEVGSGVGG
jgi:hypothetical protein